VQTIKTDWAVNHCSESGCAESARLLSIVGDSKEGLLVDSRSNKVAGKLVGHTDYSFGTSWNPNTTQLATANQDQTCRVWDVRELKRPIKVLGGCMASVRAVQYSHDGKYLAFSESADFIHIFDTDDFSVSQQIDLFGEVAGFQFSPNDEVLFVGITDCYYGCISEWRKNQGDDKL